MVEAGAVQALDALGGEQITVRDHAGDHAALADVSDDSVQISVQQRLPTRNGNDSRTAAGKSVEALKHGLERDRLREIIKLVTIRAGKVTAPHRNDVGEDR